MATVSSREARRLFSDIINRARYANEHTVITSNGKQVAAIISIHELRLLEYMLEKLEYQADLVAAREALADCDKNGGVSWEDLKAELGRE